MTRRLPAPIVVSLIAVTLFAAQSATIAAAPSRSPAPVPMATNQAQRDPAAIEDSNAESDELTLVRIPAIDSTTLERAVADQLRTWQEALAAILRQEPARADLAETFGELGQVYYAYELAAPAEACFINAHRLTPDDARWTYYLGHLTQAAGRLDEAVAHYRQTLELSPGTLPALIHLAEVYLETNQPASSRAVLQKTLELYPYSPTALAILGQIDLSERLYEEAIEHLETALEQVPEATRLHQPLAMAYRGLGDTDKARAHLAQQGSVGVRAPDPLIDDLEDLKEGERVHLLRGKMAFNAAHYEEAAESFRKAAEARPDSARAWVNLGTTLDQLGDRTGAIEQYEKALEIDPDNATAHYNLGLLRAQEGAVDAAIEHLAAAVDADPADVSAAIELAKLQRRSGQLDAALDTYTDVLAFDSLNPTARLGEAAVLVELGRFRRASARLDEAYGLHPRDPSIVNAYARLLAASPDPSVRNGERALELARRVFDAQPTVAHAESVAMALAELDRCEEAAAMQASAVTAAENAANSELANSLSRRLVHYQSQRPCREPVTPTTDQP